MPPLFLLAAAAAAFQPDPAPVTIPPRETLVAQIAQRDADFFSLFFTGACDPAPMRAFLAEDLEFYHDRAGFNARSADDFVRIFEQDCARRQNPRETRSRRELVPGSLHVDPVPGWGAIQTGEHLFYERNGADAPERLVGRARFAHLWVLGRDNQWRVSRVFSYAHGPAGSEKGGAPAGPQEGTAKE